MNPNTFYRLFICILTATLVGGCSTTYYSAMEKAGIHKRDILVDRVEESRDSQSHAQEEFKSALEQFGSVVQQKNTDLKDAYDILDAEYEDCVKAAQEVSERVAKVEKVADDLFEEWEEELELYENAALRRASKNQLQETRAQYKDMLLSMHRAEKSMAPVLKTFQDNVLFLKHNLNAQAIGSLQTEFSSLKADIDKLIAKMNTAIADSNAFIDKMGQ